MRRKLVAVAVLVAVQIAIFLIYRAVEARRRIATSFASETLTRREPAPRIDVEIAGRVGQVPGAPGRPALVHFWATWCPPCREELPGLLALAAELDLQLHAVSVDGDWATLAAYFGGRVPAGVVRAREPGAHRRYGVSTLPDSYLVDREGRLIERFAGARDWRSPAARAHLQARLAE